MQPIKKNFSPLRWLAVIVFSSAIMIACENKEEKKMDVSTEVTTDPVPATNMDSMPPIDTINNSSTRPETIKNTTGVGQ